MPDWQCGAGPSSDRGRHGHTGLCGGLGGGDPERHQVRRHPHRHPGCRWPDSSVPHFRRHIRCVSSIPRAISCLYCWPMATVMSFTCHGGLREFTVSAVHCQALTGLVSLSPQPAQRGKSAGSPEVRPMPEQVRSGVWVHRGVGGATSGRQWHSRDQDVSQRRAHTR